MLGFKMKRLIQELNTVDDSFSYTVRGESEPTYKVDSHGYLTEKGKEIGKFQLIDSQWYLYINVIGYDDKVLYMSGPPNGLFYLPEFELKALTALVNE